MKRTLFLLAIISISALFFYGCGAKEETAAHGDMAGKTTTVATGDFFEACDKWTPGDTVKFSFASSKPVMFDVHYHAKHAKKYAVDPTLTDKYEGSFVVETEAIYCCMWKNNNPKYVTLTYDMSLEKK